MDFSVLKYDDSGVILSAPFQTHINHRDSVFGGSISCLLITAAWCGARRMMEKIDERATIVIQNSNVDYLRPILSDFCAECMPIAEKAQTSFEKCYVKFGKSRIRIKSEIIKNGIIFATFSGEFVAVKNSSQ